MKTLIISILSSTIIISCTQKDVNKTDTLKQELIKADLSMSDLAVKEGFNRSLLQNADENFVKLNEGMHPSIGKKEFEELIIDRPGTKSLTWEPVKADVAQSGELGYTWGNWKLAMKDTTVYGNYFTIWKRQNDGSWKMALDGGNGTPPPK
ncbi:MAG: nuclear transport factor 2 family protein [Bacteroidota bacterium]|nr:nuclear transport factor 2 family protein [Bacteroidota bacterium]